jgi:two-component system nitrogen regulation response regulator NtrX
VSVLARILIVDDDTRLLGALRDVLASPGVTVLLAANGEEALRIAAAEELHLVITDISMPGVEGIELIRKLAKARPGVPLIAMSGHPVGRKFLRAARLFGAVQALEKPFSRRRLVELVDSLLGPGRRPEPSTPRGPPWRG